MEFRASPLAEDFPAQVLKAAVAWSAIVEIAGMRPGVGEQVLEGLERHRRIGIEEIGKRSGLTEWRDIARDVVRTLRRRDRVDDMVSDIINSV